MLNSYISKLGCFLKKLLNKAFLLLLLGIIFTQICYLDLIMPMNSVFL